MFIIATVELLALMAVGIRECQLYCRYLLVVKRHLLEGGSLVCLFFSPSVGVDDSFVLARSIR